MKPALFLAATLCLSPILAAADGPVELWKSPTGEFTVAFSGKPEVEDVPARPLEGVANLVIANYIRPDRIEHAEASLNQRTKPITKDEALHQGEAWAKFLNVSNAKMAYDEFHPEDRRLTVKGTLMVEKASMNLTAVFHWGKKTFLLVYVAESPKIYLTPEGARFLASVRQSFQATLAPAK